MVWIYSFGPTFVVFVIFGFWSKFLPSLFGLKNWKWVQKFPIFEPQYLGLKLLTSKKIFFWKSGIRFLTPIFFGILADSAIRMTYLDFWGQPRQNRIFQKLQNQEFGHRCRNFCRSAKIWPPKKTYNIFLFSPKKSSPNS